MDFEDLKKNWNGLAKNNALWAIKTEKKEWGFEEFFKTGIIDIDNLINNLNTLKINISNNKALDFGCGVGRLTQGLSNYFECVYGVDISKTMINKANEFNINEFNNKCIFLLNESETLALFDDDEFDLVYSNITLQHMDPKYSKSYVEEFLRITKPDGVIVFNIASEARGINKFKFNFVRKIFTPFLKLYYGEIMENYIVKENEIMEIVETHGGIVINIIKNEYNYYI
ncbi:MAG: class I SAM-dependent methyltransferase, partial [Methanobacterium sp.]